MTNTVRTPTPPLSFVEGAGAPESAMDALYERLSPPPSESELLAIVRAQRAKRALWLSESEARAKKRKAKAKAPAEGA